MEKLATDYVELDSKSWWSSLNSVFQVGTTGACILALCCSIIGAGLLSIPYAVSQCGLVLGGLLLILGGLAYMFYYCLLAYSCDAKGIYDYSALMHSTYGEPCRRLTELSIVCICFGGIIAYVILIPEIIINILKTFSLIDPAITPQLTVYLTFGLFLLVWLPLSLTKELTALSYGSMLSIIGISYITLLVIIESTSFIPSADYDKFSYAKFSNTFLEAVGVALFAYDGAQNIPTIYGELKHKDIKTMYLVIKVSTILLVILYSTLGIVGYLSHLDYTPEVIIFRSPFDGNLTSDWSMLISRVFVCLSLNMALTVNLYPTRLTIQQVVWGSEKKDNNLIHVGVTVGILLVAMTLALVMPSVIFYFKLLGSMFATPICVIFPCMAYCKVSDNRLVKNIAIMGAAFISILALGCFIDTLIKTFNA